MYIIVIIWS